MRPQKLVKDRVALLCLFAKLNDTFKMLFMIFCDKNE